MQTSIPASNPPQTASGSAGTDRTAATGRELVERANQGTFDAVFAQLAQFASVGASRNGKNALSVGKRTTPALGKSQLSDSLAARASRATDAPGGPGEAGGPGGRPQPSGSLAAAQRQLAAGQHARTGATSVSTRGQTPGAAAESGTGDGKAQPGSRDGAIESGPGTRSATSRADAGSMGPGVAGIAGAAGSGAARAQGAAGSNTALASLGRAQATAPGGGPTTATNANAVALGGRANGPTGQPTPSARARAPQTADPAKTAAAFRTQIAQGLSAALRQGRGEVTLRLTPKALGELRISLTVQNGSVDAKVKPATTEAHRLLEQGVESLRHALEARGLKVGRIEIDQPPAPKSESTGAQQQNSPAGQDGQTGMGGDGGRHDPAEPGGSPSRRGDGMPHAAEGGPESESDVLDTPSTAGGPGVVYGVADGAARIVMVDALA